MYSFIRLINAIAVIAVFRATNASPVESNGAVSNLLKRNGSDPHFVLYGDQWVSGENGPPPVSAIEGFNVFILSFLLGSGPVDQALEWSTLDNGTRTGIVDSYHQAGISLIVSAFGSTETPTSSKEDPIGTANTMAAWVKEYNLDGIDVDYEDFGAMNTKDGSAENWLIAFTKQLRSQLPEGRYIITHAPVAPWFCGYEQYPSGAYLAVEKSVGDMIDWYNVQFYNQGTTEYTTCSGLLTTSSSTWPNSALFQIAENVNENKLVIGKPATAGDANNGYMDPSMLANCVQQAMNVGWKGGVMAWEYPNAAAPWIKTVRSQSWPVSG